jgi:hypothetical protein
MKNLKWEKVESSFLLKNDHDILVSLDFKAGSASVFTIGSNVYRIEKKGVWVPALRVLSGDIEILNIKHNFWGSKGIITFFDGTTYQIDYNHGKIWRISFLDQEKEILSYSTVFEKNRPAMSFNMGTAILDAEKLLILTALGFVMFYAAFRENSASEEMKTFLLLIS